MNRKVVFLTLCIILTSLLAYTAMRFRYLDTTRDLPYRNLLSSDIGGCFIYFHVKHNNNVDTVVMTNTSAVGLISSKSELLGKISPYYLYEVIKNEWAIEINDSVFNELREGFVNPRLVSEYENQDVFSNTSLIKDGHQINISLNGSERNSLIYTLLRKGTNCCIADETGMVVISNKE